MTKAICVILDDRYHPKETYRQVTEELFGRGDWVLRTTESIRDLCGLEKKPDLALNFTGGRPEGSPALSAEEQQVLVRAVEAGMGMLYVHAGLTLIEPDSPIFRLARGRFVSHPPEHLPVRCGPIPGISHPIMEGVAPFAALDEHYFCQTAIEGSQPFLCTLSQHGSEVGGWAHVQGAGRVACLTPGHTAGMLEQMRRLIANAANWCIGQS